MYARFGGEFSETYRRNTARRWVLSLRLTTQYLFIFAGGLIGVFILVVILNLSGLNNFSCILFGIVAGSVLVWGVFYLNNKYGPHGLMKRMALKQHPRRIIHRRSVRRLFNR